MITVEVTPNDVHLCGSHGILRRYEKLCGRRSDRPQNGLSTWDNEIEGACAEWAWSKLRNVFPSGISGLKATDCGDGTEIRWTRHDNGGLIIHKHDTDDRRFVLAKGSSYELKYHFVGWLWGRDGKKNEWMTKYGYFLVPFEKINEMPQTLPQAQ